ncbi:hypothetical protein TNCV_1207491 [Trichonephila clavipes]|nr:hypothetical protein TNCV_1207491 [Trichonephila clavipes]
MGEIITIKVISNQKALLRAENRFSKRPLSGRSYSGQSGYSKNRDQKVREKISGGGNMGCGTKESDFIGRARSSDNGE